jgi:hypothetical protein
MGKRSIYLVRLCDFAQAVEIVSAPMDGRPLWLIRRVKLCSEAKKLADALKEVAARPELVVLRVMSRVDGVDSFSIKNARRTKHCGGALRRDHLCSF